MADPTTLAGIVSNALNFGKKVRDLTTPSLTAFTKQANIMSRLYIEDNILRDDICPPLVGVLNQLYVSYILSALNMDTMCANGKTVREQFEIVSTENVDIIKDILDNFGKTTVKPSFEDAVQKLEPETQRLPVGRVIEITMNGIQVLKETTSRGGDMTTTTHGERITETTHPEVTVSDSNGDRTTPEHTDTQKTNQSNDYSRTEYGQSTRTSDAMYQFKAYLYVQLIPYVLKPEIVDGYIGANFNPPINARWRQYKAGEISFWKDFVFARDLIKKQAKLFKKDKNNIIYEMLNKNEGSLFSWWKNAILSFFGKSVSHNLANTMLIVNKTTFDRACRENHINFADKNQRNRFFTKTWSMIIAVVDPLYNTVDMYFNGVDAKGTYNFNMINKVGAKGSDSFDLKEVMTAFSQGLSPKF